MQNRNDTNTHFDLPLRSATDWFQLNLFYYCWKFYRDNKNFQLETLKSLEDQMQLLVDFEKLDLKRPETGSSRLLRSLPNWLFTLYPGNEQFSGICVFDKM